MKYPIKPHFYETEPKPIISKINVMESIQLFQDGRVEIPKLESGQYIRFDKNSGLYDDDSYFLQICREEKIPNVNYEKELMKYNVFKAEHDRRMEVYNAEMAVYTREQQETQEERELVEYERLKKKFSALGVDCKAINLKPRA